VNTIRLLIADDHSILREGIVSLLQPVPDLSIVATAANGHEVLNHLKTTTVDICLLDINMPGLDGMELVKCLGDKYPEVKVIILTTYNDHEIVSEFLHLGVSGYLLKNADKEELVEAIRKVKAGRHYFSREIEDIILIDITKKKDPPLTPLTEREEEIVQLLALEYTNDRIAAELHISYRTVETHRKNIMQKTKTQNLAGLMRYAFSKGLIK